MEKPILLLLFLFGITVCSNAQTNPQNLYYFNAPQNQVAVPNLIGKNVDTAKQLIDSVGLGHGTITDMRSNQPPGTVIRQFPAARLIVNRGTSLNLYISQRPPAEIVPSINRTNLENAREIRRARIPANLSRIQLVTVPPLVGRNFNQDEISSILKEVGLQLGKVVPVVNDEKSGIIISQSPEEWQQVRPNTAVDITYGANVQPATPGVPENVIVPDYIGMKIDRAIDRIPNDRLALGSQSEISLEKPIGEVVEQFPPPNSEVDPGTPVQLKYSSGPQSVQYVEVPNLLGLTLQQAADTLLKNQLYAGQLIEQDSEKGEGEILNQSPTAGTLVAAGSTVDIIYSVLVLENHPNVNNAKQILPWIYWIGGIVAALLLGGYLGWKSGKGKRERSARKEPEIKVKIIPDTGKQTFHLIQSRQAIKGLQLKIIPDKGVQTLKIN